MKKCRCCGKIKALNKFYKKKTRKDGHRDWCKKCEIITTMEYAKRNKQKCAKWQKTYADNHKKQIQKYMKKYLQDNYDKIRKYRKEYERNYYKNRRKIDILFRISHNLRTRIRTALKRNSKSLKTVALLSCSIPKLKQYLEKKFKKGMTWDNYGDWHVDHIIPCASFDLNKKNEQKKCFHYTNLQPLWAGENARKKDNI